MEMLINLVQKLFTGLGYDSVANTGDVIGILSILLLLVLTTSFIFSRSEEEKDAISLNDQEEVLIKKEILTSNTKDKEIIRKDAIKISWSERLTKGLRRSQIEVWGKISGLFTGNKLSEEALEEIEELLYSADIGPSAASELIDKIEENSAKDGFGETEFKDFLFKYLKDKMEPHQKNVDANLYNYNKNAEKKLKVIMIVGVNGAGKTTTIGKLATKLTKQGAKVVVGACDTFRAAAVDQLEVWCERAGAEMIRAKEGSSPSGVGYAALEKAKSLDADYCILDTAGRLHNNGNLMEELKKSKKVLAKIDESAPHHVLLVLDAITGQNALRQAEEFNKTLELTGLIFTKCDGSSKAGSAISIVDKLKLPITYIGVGETVEDLNEFSLDDYLRALLG